MESKEEIVNFFWVGTIVMACLGIGVIFLVLFYQNYLFKRKGQEAEQLLKVSLESEKKERQRIAADLHDGVSSDLSAIRNYLVIILKEEKDEARIELFEDLKDGVEDAIENTRQISYRLMPPLFDTVGFALTMDDFLKKLKKRSGLPFTLSGIDEKFDLNVNVSYELFRIIQELTTNMLKYGAISFCNIKLYTIKNRRYVSILDDGRPFNFDQALINSKGTGLKNISARLKIINAKLEQQPVTAGNFFLISILIEDQLKQ